MAGRRELGFPKAGGCNLREQLARTTLRNVRSQGHTCIELREDGKRVIFFCTLCLAPCYSDSVLFDHLKGNLHTERYAAAKATLLKSNPFPFNDGVHFFHDSPEEEKEKENALISASNTDRFSLLDTDNGDENRFAIVRHGGTSRPNTNGQVSQNGFVSEDYSLIIPHVLHKDEVSDLEVRLLGIGQIAARVREKDGLSQKTTRIWCEWLGKKETAADDANHDVNMIPEHDYADYAIVTFAYNYDLGRKGLIEDVKYLLLSSPQSEKEENLSAKKKQRTSLSDVDDVSESLSNQSDSSGEESLTSSTSPNSKLVLHRYDDQILQSRVILSKTLRKELRRQQRVAAERMCDICQHKMLPGKDVATLLNKKTGKLACSSRNVNGVKAFHVYHISCLVHWILLCEMELCTKQSVASPEVKRRSRRKNSAKSNKKGKKVNPRKQMNSVFCPECQGTGINIDGDELEKPIVPLSEMFRYKIKVSDARRAWMKCPEVLENCSTGFHFPSQSEEETIQEKVSPLKLLHFYRADE